MGQGPAQATQDTNLYRPAGSQRAQGPRPANGTQTYTPVRQSTRPAAPVPGQLQLDIRRDPAAQQPGGYTRPAQDSLTQEERSAMEGDLRNYQAARQTPPGRLNLDIKVDRPVLEDAPAEPDAAPAARKRVRRTERNKDLYDQDDPSDNA